jgi:hypothetical protein
VLDADGELVLDEKISVYDAEGNLVGESEQITAIESSSNDEEMHVPGTWMAREGQWRRRSSPSLFQRAASAASERSGPCES